MKKYLHDCKTTEEKNELLGEYIETIYFQTLNQNKSLSRVYANTCEIIEKLNAIALKLNYVGATQEEREFINPDGSIKYDAINAMCDGILEKCEILNIPDKVQSEVVTDGKDEE